MATPFQLFCLDGGERKFLVRRLEFLQADSVGLGLLQPTQQHRQPSVHAVHVVGGDLQRVLASLDMAAPPA
jgi:hypothetical protein